MNKGKTGRKRKGTSWDNTPAMFTCFNGKRKHVEYNNNIIIKVSYNVNVHQVGHLPRVVPGCTVSKNKKNCTF